MSYSLFQNDLKIIAKRKHKSVFVFHLDLIGVMKRCIAFNAFTCITNMHFAFIIDVSFW